MFRLYINGPARGTRFVWSCRSCGRDPAALVQIFTYCWQCNGCISVRYTKACCGLSRQSLSKISRSICWGWFPFQRVMYPLRCTVCHTPVSAVLTFVLAGAWTRCTVHWELHIAEGLAMQWHRVCGSDFMDLNLLGVENGLQCFPIWRFHFLYVSEKKHPLLDFNYVSSRILFEDLFNW